MGNDGAVVVSAGCQTAVGLTAAATAAAVRASISGFAEHPYVVNSRGDRVIVGRVPAVPEDAVGVARLTSLMIAPLQEALAGAVKVPRREAPLALVLGLPVPRPGLADDVEKQLSASLGAAGLLERFDAIEMIRADHAAGLLALAAGRRRATRGEVCVVGGVDSWLEPETLEWLDQTERLHGEDNPLGFIPGEAAGFCVLASRSLAARHGLAPWGDVVHVATGQEANTIAKDAVCTGEGLTRVIREAVEALPSPNALIQEIYCDLNGESHRADEYGFTLVRVARRFVDATAVTVPADCWGDVCAASGPLFAILAAFAFRKGYAKGPHALLWNSSETGERAAALLVGPKSGGQ
jgi:3-oxoacyl-[acyl-carrier-protein] synthase-1